MFESFDEWMNKENVNEDINSSGLDLRDRVSEIFSEAVQFAAKELGKSYGSLDRNKKNTFQELARNLKFVFDGDTHNLKSFGSTKDDILEKIAKIFDVKEDDILPAFDKAFKTVKIGQYL